MLTTSPPPPAADATAPQPVEPEEQTSWRSRFWVVLAALVLGLGGLAIYAATRPDDPADAFSWDVDDLADWVTQEEMTQAFEDALTLDVEGDVDGEVVLDRPPTQPGEWQWSYRLAGDSDSWRVMAHDGDHEGRSEELVLGQTDPRLPDGVVFEPASGFAHGFYMLSGPNSDESICLTLWPPGQSLGYPSTSEVEVHEDRVFAIASVLLREMAWVN